MERVMCSATHLVLLTLWASAHGTRKFGPGVELVANAQSKFGMDMFQALTIHDNSSNIFFSPTSISTALALVYAGSGGKTAQQMAAVLHFESGERRDFMHGHRRYLRRITGRSKEGVTVKIANNLYVSLSRPVMPKYVRFAKNMFGADVSSVDFGGSPAAAADLINTRVRNDTEGNIDNLVEEDALDEGTVFVVVNAVYFKGSWLLKFNESDTAPGQFHAADGPRSVDMMTATKLFPTASLPGLDARALMLPYQGEELGMLILLPNELNGIYELEALVDHATLVTARAHLSARVEVHVQLPKFNMEAEIDLSVILKEMGVTDLFDPSRADLSGITGETGMAISKAVHKAFVNVNEEGTEAAAATAFACCFRSAPPIVPPFIVDRPFIFAIMDLQLDSVLFMGRVMSLGSARPSEAPPQ
ncbi:leukocyte elastase inhibitor A-like [Pollicipes pollicipes]|uniref:leukocyte elastase inhibitor A-like n=1 Tax=Pollicipes pollicipes TaxID=41117 RepID=UPI001884EC55|nr:leukocyte elastase inhibitor A-like [Pollicipes pollicipes]